MHFLSVIFNSQKRFCQFYDLNINTITKITKFRICDLSVLVLLLLRLQLERPVFSWLMVLQVQTLLPFLSLKTYHRQIFSSASTSTLDPMQVQYLWCVVVLLLHIHVHCTHTYTGRPVFAGWWFYNSKACLESWIILTNFIQLLFSISISTPNAL